MKNTTKRAKKGGEIGANGEFYEGGKFINTAHERAKRFGSTPKAPPLRRVPVRPGVWMMQEKPGQRPLLSFCGVGAGLDRSGNMEIFLPPFETEYGGVGFCGGVSLAQMQEFCDRYNAGEIWV